MKRTVAERSSADTHPDTWQRFEKAVDIGLTTKPMHKQAKRKVSNKKKKLRA